jgi:CBS domain-containing protein
VQPRTVRSVIEGQTVIKVSAQVSVADAARLMQRHRVGALLVMQEERLRGIFTERDALFKVIAQSLDPQATPVGQVMTRDPQTVAPDRPFAHALDLMHEGGFRHVPVVENGRPLGVVSARDALGNELTQFVDELEARERIGQVLR